MVKIAIKANPSRGKEIISLLESLGGIKSSLEGIGECYTYYINEHNVIIYDSAPKNYKVYTLEEFEKEFPLKIGDIVLLKGTDLPYEIVALEWFMNKLCYKLDNGLHYAPNTLTTYEKMKEERNITLTLDKAKEWYNKGGELKEIALQAFTEEELTKVELPKTWEEYIQQNFHREGYVLTHLGSIAETEITGLRGGENLCPSKQSAEAHLAMIQLEQLRDCWRQGWKPNWLDDTLNYIIEGWRDDYTVNNKQVTHGFLSFPTYKMAAEFLECFKDLIEKAGDLI